jgi:hypothetical protein
MKALLGLVGQAIEDMHLEGTITVIVSSNWTATVLVAGGEMTPLQYRMFIQNKEFCVVDMQSGVRIQETKISQS